MTTTGKKLKVVFVLILLSLSNILPVTAIAEAADNPTMLEIISAEITSDQSGKKALNVKLNANNNSTKKVEKEIGLVENYLSDVERKEGDGYAYQVKSGKTMLEISPNTKQTINLSLPIDPTLYHSQTNKLIVDNKEYDITDAKEHKKETEVSTSNTDETKEGVSEENENSVSPFTLPRLSLPAVTVSTNQTISTEYTTDDQGTYPKANWQPTGNTNVLDHQGNKNGSNQWDGINSWDGDPNDRTHSYIEYGGTGNQADYAIRKFAKETTTPGLFDVYLNARGNVQKDITPLDLVLVVDWSGSMNDNNRIGEVKIGVDRFVDTLADSGITDKINMGYVGYSSEGYSYSNGAVQMGSFDSVKNQVKSITPSRTNGGTFTQKALRDAGNMLSVPNGHKKVIVLLTDGVPTFSYEVQRVHAQSSSNYYGTQFSNTQDQPGNTSRIARSYDAPDQNNLSRRIDSTFIATIGEAMALKERGIEIHGLGIQLQSDPAAGLSKAEVESRMRQMVSSDEKGDLYYESADHATDISEYLAKKAVQISATVSNGQINDPIAEPFIYQPGTLSVKSVGTSPTTVTPSISIEGNTIKSNQIYLGKDQEIQIHYQVRIQTENEDFHPNFWYQMNGRTTFQPNIDTNELAEFGIPSAKAPGVSLHIKKLWEEFDNNLADRPDQVTFEKVLEEPRNDFTIGEKITYSLHTTIPVNILDYQKFELSDSADEALTFLPNSLTISSNGEKLTEGFVIHKKPHGFDVLFSIPSLEKYAGKKLTISYQMQLSSTAQANKEINNNGTLDFGFGISTKKVSVYTGSKQFVKIETNKPDKRLAGAVFLIKNKAGNYLQRTANGYKWTSNESDALHLTSDKNGAFSIIGLRTGDYWLKELKAPSGYILSETEIPFTISTSLSEDKETVGRLKVVNRKENSRPFLPKTNETKNILLVVVGMVFASLAIWLFIKKRTGVTK